MLSQIFRAGDPVLEVALPPETRQKLEGILEDLPRDVFVADDSLGWVYQFWQTAEKERVNKSEKKIGADELPAVTQLFTEDYMVLFLLHNTLGAWWAGKRLADNLELARSAESEEELRKACGLPGVEWTYLRFVRGDDDAWRPAAGTFDGWPKAASKITMLDPCMGSGHFLVFALPILVAFRMSEEGLSCEEAVYAVLRDNLFGLEIDPRCTQIAAFNLALAGWRMAGYQQLPALQLACSGLSLGVSKSEWLKLAERAAAATALPPKRDLFGSEENLFSARIKDGFERLYDLFAKAPWIGSLLNPRAMGGDIFAAGFKEMEPLLAQVLSSTGDEEMTEAAIAAQGMSKAAELLGRKFTLIATNVPYLTRGKQDEVLKLYSKNYCSDAKADLATCFIKRCLDYCDSGGSTCLVTPQNWLFLGAYESLRRDLLRKSVWTIVAKLGPAAFQDMNWWAANTVMFILGKGKPSSAHKIAGLDVSGPRDPQVKALLVQNSPVVLVDQAAQLRNPDARLLLSSLPKLSLLQEYAISLQGISPADFAHYGRFYWEILNYSEWRFWQSTIEETIHYGGRELVLWWNQDFLDAVDNGNAFIRGEGAWNRKGVVVSQMRHLPCSLYTGEAFDTNCAVIIPIEEANIAAIWAFCSSPQYFEEIRKIDQQVKVTNATLVKIPFDLPYWQQVANEGFPNGLPAPNSNDPTQWLFNGHPRGSEQPLQVAVARLLGYQWPRQTGSEFPDCPALEPDGLEGHADEDGIVCLTPLRGEASAADRLRPLLADAFGDEWSAAKQNELLTAAGFAGKSLEDWLRDGFFEQHCEVFHQRPFIWHIWDGLRNGFSALINYHKLAAPNGDGRRALEKLIYTYLGDWIDRQRADQKSNVEGADARVAAAEHLKRELEKILQGEPPYDIFVRWKPLDQQPIGWEPDINDGVRINIRPLMTPRPLNARAKNACILRITPKIKWDKDRGKEPVRDKEDFPWFWSWDGETGDFTGGKTFDGNRWNDLHYSRAFKQAARERKRD
jgi:Eco57I restriction-modification methylase